MIRAVYGLMGLGMCLLSAPALANLSLVNYNGFEVRQSGSTWTFSHEPPSSTALRGGTVLPNAAVSSSQRALVVSKTLPVGKGLPVDVVAKIPAANLAKALVGAGRYATPIGAVIGVIEIANYLNHLGIQDVRNTSEGLVGKRLGDGVGDISDGYLYRINTGGIDSGNQISKSSACEVWIAMATANDGHARESLGVNGSQCRFKGAAWPGGVGVGISQIISSCQAGNYYAGGVCSPSRPLISIDEQEIIDLIAVDSGWPSSAAIAAQKALNMGIPIQTEAPTVTGPSNIPGEKTTSKESVSLSPGTNTEVPPGTPNAQPGTKTTTKTETKKAEYSGSKVTTSTTTNTVTNITNNVTNITTTVENKTEEKEDDKEQEEPPTDTPFKDVPELYKQKYPDGIGGVVNKKMDELKATPLFGLPALLTPSLPSTGSCPSWQIDLSLASWAGYGMHTIQAPCWVWDFGKVVIIISALLLARRLIFGG